MYRSLILTYAKSNKMLILSYWNSDSSAVSSKNVFLVLNKGHTFLQGKLDESSLIWTYKLKQMTFSVSFSPGILQSGSTDPWWIMKHRISNECLSRSGAHWWDTEGKFSKEKPVMMNLSWKLSLNWQVQGMELKHSFHACQDPRGLLCSIGIRSRTDKPYWALLHIWDQHLCREVLGEKLVITGRALEVFTWQSFTCLLLVMFLMDSRCDPLSNILIVARFLCQEPPTIDFISTWGMCVRGNCSELLQNMWE